MAEKTHTLSIDGMTCGCCSGRVKNALNAIPGVLQALISHETNSGIVITDASISTEELLAVVGGTGFDVRA